MYRLAKSKNRFRVGKNVMKGSPQWPESFYGWHLAEARVKNGHLEVKKILDIDNGKTWFNLNIAKVKNYFSLGSWPLIELTDYYLKNIQAKNAQTPTLVFLLMLKRPRNLVKIKLVKMESCWAYPLLWLIF